jgi:hypothetical protein
MSNKSLLLLDVLAVSGAGTKRASYKCIRKRNKSLLRVVQILELSATNKAKKQREKTKKKTKKKKSNTGI